MVLKTWDHFHFICKRWRPHFIENCFAILIYYLPFPTACFILISIHSYFLLFLDLPLSMSFLPLHITFGESWGWVNLTPSWDAFLGTLFIHDVFHIFITWMLIVLFILSYPEFSFREQSQSKDTPASSSFFHLNWDSL